MEFDLTQDYPAGLDRLWAALGRVEFIEQKYRALGSTGLQVRTFVCDDRVIEVELDRQAPIEAAELPVWARLLSGRKQAIRHHTRWVRAGRDRVDVVLEIRAVGRGVAATGLGSVREARRGCSRMTLHVEVATTSPVVPAGAADLFARQLRRALEADHEYTVAYLRSDAPRRRGA